MNKPITATAVERMRRWARQHARDTSVPYGRALEQAARDAGFASWHEVRRAAKAAAAAGASDLPVDPELPPNFDQTANEDRSKAELDAWWLRPFAQTSPDGALDVRCLDGGAWDRPTFYGTAKDLDEARALADAKLARWQEIRDTPAVLLLDDGGLLTLEPNRPGMPRPVLLAAGSQDALRRVLANWEQLCAADPQTAQILVRSARDRSARVPSYDQVQAAFRRAVAEGLAHPDGSPVAVQEVALLLGLHAFADPVGAEVRFTLPELAHYLWEFAVEQANVGALFERAQLLRAGGSPVIVTVAGARRDEIDHWVVRLAPSRWLKARRGGRR